MIAEARMQPPQHRPDLDLLSDIETALSQDSVIRTFDRSSLKVEARAGEVTLAGHMASMRRKQVEDIVRAVPGVRVIHNQIIDDADLVMAVAVALAADPRTEPHLIRVGAFHGWIYLMGKVPAAVVTAAEEVAAQVPDVRGILGLPETIETEHQLATRPGTRRPLQPMPGSEVYAEDIQVGRVSQVVINPRNKLVSHIAVRAEVETNDQTTAQGEFVVPVEAIELVNEGGGGIYLRETSASLIKQTVFNEDDYPLPSKDWEPPFPYLPGQVRWPHSTQ